MLPAVVVANSVNVVMDNAKTLVAVVVVGRVGRQATNTAAETIVCMGEQVQYQWLMLVEWVGAVLLAVVVAVILSAG